MPPVLQTARLRLDPWTLDDLPRLHADPAVARYLGGEPWTREQARTRLSNFMREHRDTGLSKWRLSNLATGQLLGRAGFGRLPETGEYELGHSLSPAAWGQGYATEIAAALAGWFFQYTPHAHFIGFAHVENAASRRVLEKIGMVLIGERDWHGAPHALYRLELRTYAFQQHIECWTAYQTAPP